MALLGQGTVIPGEESADINTSSKSNICVGVNGSTYRIIYTFGGPNEYWYPDSNDDGIVLAAASTVRVRNTGAEDLYFEVYVV